MKLSNIEFSVKTVAAALAIIQGSAWTIMSLICIILFHSQPVFLTNPTSYMENLGRVIYYTFLTNNSIFSAAEMADRSFTPDVFAGFMWIYFFLDIVWIGTTIYMLRKNSKQGIMAWSYVTLFVCFWDFLTFVILGADYDNCLYHSGSTWWSDVITDEGVGAIPVDK
ncbi:hypothetical protein Zmor_005147 [Zophobas morio]|uniref:Uncharacterized protein n=1 Tax=Zophobas morio TaxID=2755281 RepID=A0AA38MKC1_9CUCU|nr:hypothetical protein Zmor_005147 [Zophobas morio]